MPAMQPRAEKNEEDVFKCKKCSPKKSEHQNESQSLEIYEQTLNNTNTAKNYKQQILSLVPKSAKTKESRNIPGTWKTIDGSCFLIDMEESPSLPSNSTLEHTSLSQKRNQQSEYFFRGL